MSLRDAEGSRLECDPGEARLRRSWEGCDGRNICDLFSNCRRDRIDHRIGILGFPPSMRNFWKHSFEREGTKKCQKCGRLFCVDKSDQREIIRSDVKELLERGLMSKK